MELTESQMLKYAMDNGIIDINTLQMQIEMNERRKVFRETQSQNLARNGRKMVYKTG